MSLLVGVFSPCSSDTISRSVFNNDIVINVIDSSIKITSFELSYKLKNSDSVYIKSFKANKIVMDCNDDFFRLLGEAQFLVIDNITALKANQQRRLPTIVKCIRAGK